MYSHGDSCARRHEHNGVGSTAIRRRLRFESGEAGARQNPRRHSRGTAEGAVDGRATRSSHLYRWVTGLVALSAIGSGICMADMLDIASRLAARYDADVLALGNGKAASL